MRDIMRELIALSAVCLCIVGGPLSAYAQTSPPAAARPHPVTRAAERIGALHREADALAQQQRTLLGDLRRLEVERDLKVEETRRLDAQAAALQEQIDGTTRQIQELRTAIEAARPALERRLVEIYKLGRPGYARLLLGVGSVRDAGRAVRLTTGLAAMDQRRAAEPASSIDRLRQAGADLELRAGELAGVRHAAQVAAAEARAAAQARADLVRQIDARRDLAAQMAGELEVARQRLSHVVPGAITDASLPIKPFRGTLGWPVRGRLVSRFGQRRNPQSGTGVTQNGIEIAAGEGQAVHAVHDGRVVFADVFAGLGQLVIVDHGQLGYSLYGYLGALTVIKGARVSDGDAVGTVGRSSAGTPALYFELRIDGRPVNPLQ
ncbi:MAG TPA: peptidoglycan DD-metalloendopeptidase family protein, partial [Arenibaculum sp.]|nr:peptidoglycan DD-metalloendopeptidase family protein [Arenibaculum sp.]